jgi:uncharacterized membrane protein YdjX (TVP38/TMEM64 family)
MALPGTPAPPSLRRAILRFALFAAVLVAGFLALRLTPLREYLTREAVAAALAALRAAWWAPLALVGLYVLLAPLGVPMTPLILAGGAVFGAVWGTLYNFLGTFLGALASFVFGRTFGRDLVVHLLGDRLERVERLIERHGFWALIRARFVPLPFAVVNYAAALAGVRLGVFAAATAIGLLPAIALYTYFAAALAGAAAEARGDVLRKAGLAAIGLLLISALPTLVRLLRRQRVGQR